MINGYAFPQIMEAFDFQDDRKSLLGKSLKAASALYSLYP